MKLFHRVPPRFFTSERAIEFEAFAEQAQEFAYKEGNGASYLVDMFSEDPMLWEDFLDEIKGKTDNPIIDNRGNLDFLGACVLEGIDLAKVWDNVCWSHQQNLQGDFSQSGLHGLHFRMNISNPKDRITCTLGLAFALYEVSPGSFRACHNPVQALLALAHNRSVVSSYFNDSRHWSVYSAENTRLLMEGAQSASPEAFHAALDQYLQMDAKQLSGWSPSSQALKIEKALIPLVYNYGYRLKAAGVSNEDILQKASANIDALLKFVDLSQPFQKALTRQILINLFSPFPDGLEMMDAKPEELQGVSLDPVLVDDPASEGFRYTLSGPVAVFGADQSTKKDERRTQILEYFKDSPDEIDFEVAIHGRMAKSAIIVDLFADQAGGHSVFMDEVLSGQRPPVYMDDAFLGHLMHRDRVKLYSDQAVLSLAASSIDYLKDNARFSRSVFMGQGSKSLDLTFKERPHLRDKVLQLLVDKELLTPDVFDWFGFGQRELKIVGHQAPKELKQHVLHDALGL
jgi:hypothetical protein